MATQLLFSLVLLSFLSLSSPLPTQSILNAIPILSNSGYVSMALTLEFGSQSIIPPSPSLTIFSPSDTAFAQSGQPSLSLLHFHFSPHSFPFHALKSLPPATRIPTLFTDHSLTITSSPSDGDEVLLNGVKINGSEIYNDGSLVIFGIDKFFDPDFEVSGSISPHLGCSLMASGNYYSFEDASAVLRSRGYSVMASFLDLQLAEFKDQTMFTIFAPLDEVMKGFVSSFSEYGSIFLRHVVPCKISWSDLVTLDNGVVLPTYLEGFNINISKSSNMLTLNGVQVIVPEMFSNSWLQVHGLRGSFVVQDRLQEASNSTSGKGSNAQKNTVDFKVMKLLLAFSFLFISFTKTPTGA